MPMHTISFDEYCNAECLTEIVDALLSQSNSRESQKIPQPKKSPTGPTERTPKPEYLKTLPIFLGVRW